PRSSTITRPRATTPSSVDIPGTTCAACGGSIGSIAPRAGCASPWSRRSFPESAQAVRAGARALAPAPTWDCFVRRLDHASSITSRPSGRLLARNTLYNVFGQALPVLVGLGAIPVTLRSLGEAGFGLLGLAWAILGYIGVLDLGLGRATTKFVAEYLAARDAARLHGVTTVAVASQTAMGVLGGVGLALIVPFLAGSVLGVPPALSAEARRMLFALALSVPFVVLSASLRAILEAAQRFDLVNLIRTPTSAAVLIVPAVAAAFGADLPRIVLLLLLVRIAACWATSVVIP